MSVTVLLEVTTKPGRMGDLLRMFTENFKQTRVYEGCIDLYMARSEEDPDTVVVVQQWERRSAYDHYLAWRTETGMLDKLMSLAATPPSIRYFERLDA